MRNSKQTTFSKYRITLQNAKIANKYIVSINPRLYLNKGLTEFIIPVASIVSMTATATVTDIITQRQSNRIYAMLAGIFMIIICEFLLTNIVYILEAFSQMTEMDVQEACKTQLIKALKEKSLTEIEDPDVIDVFSMHMSRSIYSVSSAGLIIFRIGTAILNIITAIITCFINKVSPVYFMVLVMPYLFLILPFTIKVEEKLHKVRNDSYHHLTKYDRKLNKVESLFQMKDSIFDIKRRKITESLLQKFCTLHNEDVEAHIEVDTQQRKLVDKKSFLSYLYTSFLYIIVYLLVILGFISYGGAVLLIAAITQFSQSFRNFIVEIKFLNESMFLTNEYFDFVKPSKVQPDMRIESMNSICLRNVSYQYKAYSGSEKYQLRNVNLMIEKGEKIAIVGRNGAGKTTLTKLIMGLYTPTTGECFINNIPYSELVQNDILKLFSIGTQETTIYPMSLKENIILSDSKEQNDMLYNKVCNSTGVRKLYESDKNDNVMLRKEIFEDAVDFSGGEKQKIKLARALYADRDIIIFDEPLSSLDTTSEKNFIDLLFNDYKDRTVIIITHNLSCTKRCNKIISIEDGMVREIGSHKELLQNKGLYYKLYMTQAQRYKEVENEND